MAELKKDGEFSLYWWDADEGQHEELRFVPPERAVMRAQTLIQGPAALIGIVQRVIITDGGDFTNFEWKHGEGVIYPPQRKEP